MVPDEALEAGVTQEAVSWRRRKLGIAPYTERDASLPARLLRGAEYDRMRSRGMRAAEIAEDQGISVNAVFNCLRRYYRRLDEELGISHKPSGVKRWDPQHDALLGTMSDTRVANKTGFSVKYVRERRQALDIAPCPWKRASPRGSLPQRQAVAS